MRRLRHPALRRRLVALALLLLALPLLEGCGRKDIGDYPPDAVERPGTLPRRGDPIRYY